MRADVTEETAPYEYTFSEEYLEEHDGEAPYVNLGEIVLDGGRFTRFDSERVLAETAARCKNLESEGNMTANV